MLRAHMTGRKQLLCTMKEDFTAEIHRPPMNSAGLKNKKNRCKIWIKRKGMGTQGPNMVVHPNLTSPKLTPLNVQFTT